MGSCVSLHKDRESAMKFGLSLESKNDKIDIPSPVKQKPDGNLTIADVALKSNWSPARPVATGQDFGSKEETFFDSQPWLESDCEDDFLSVTGDFTPSRGSTPVHQNSSVGTTPVSKPNLTEGAGSVVAPSPGDKKKKLSELFKESLRGDPNEGERHATEDQNEGAAKVQAQATPLVLPPKPKNGTPHVSGGDSMTSSERTPNGVLRSEDKFAKSAQCCFPRLRQSRSYSESTSIAVAE